MPTPNETISLLIGGQVHRHWTRYEIDSDLLVPADAWTVALGLPRGEIPPVVQEGAAVVVRVGADTVMSGRIDDIADQIDARGHSLSLSGRDGAAVLVDCSAPILSGRAVTLAQIVQTVVRPLGVTRVRIDSAAGNSRSDKVAVEPGDTAWDTLARAAEARGLWPWMDPDGTLVVGGPDYTRPPVARLVLRRDGAGNNLLSLRRVRSMANRYSDITLLGQGHGTAAESGRHALRAQVKDAQVPVYRPRVVVDGDTDNNAAASARARKLLADSRLSGLILTAEVRGHRTADGVLWQPGQRVHLVAEPLGLDGVYFIMARRFTGGASQGTTTTLTLREDGVWIVDGAKQSAKKGGKGKRRAAEEIINVD
ncbi:phage baseplate assembly protein [Chitiniphilus eburneus]|uniref:phage baseplate assembly protein n=1 Tax=Chitiniphilus eburneus TaxID=2571148 RepID=UPI0035CF0FC9